MGLPIQKKFKDRHLILKALFDKYELDYRPDMDETEGTLTFAQIANETGLDNTTLNNELLFLDREGEVYYNEVRYERHYGARVIGRVAYTDEKYLEIGEEVFWNSAKNYISIVAIIISAIALWWSIHSSNKSSDKMKELQDRIEVLEKK